LLHVNPGYKSPKLIEISNLADNNNLLDVDKHSLQHKRYSNIFGVGNVCNLPTVSSESATLAQAVTVAQNINSTFFDKAIKGH